MGKWRSSAREEQPYLCSVLLLVSHEHKLLVCVFPQVVNSNDTFFKTVFIIKNKLLAFLERNCMLTCV